jgi:Trypsin-like peptidase domain
MFKRFGIAIFALFMSAHAFASYINGPDIDKRPSGVVLPADSVTQVAQNEPQVANTGNPSVAPLKWVGLLISPDPTKDHPNQAAECTGQFIKPNIVLTAAHCIKDVTDNPTGPWFDLTKQTFVLQYQNGEGSHTFKTVCAATAPGWAVPSNYATLKGGQKAKAQRVASEHDFALVLVDGNSPTGTMPYALDWKGKASAAVRVGYAADILDGEIIQQAEGIVFFSNAIPMFPESPPNLVVHWQSVTDLSQGSSGGAWIANFSTDDGANNNILIAVTSFGNSDYPGAVMGAYLTAAEFNPLLAYVSNGCK